MSKQMMSKKIVPFIDPKKPVCKWDACSTQASVKGLCRLHFLKSLKAAKPTAEEELEREAVTRMKKDRRRNNRIVTFEDSATDSLDVQNRFSTIDTLDLDIDVMDSGHGGGGGGGGKDSKTGTDD